MWRTTDIFSLETQLRITPPSMHAAVCAAALNYKHRSRTCCGHRQLVLDVSDSDIQAAAAAALPDVGGLKSLKLRATEGKHWHRGDQNCLCRNLNASPPCPIGCVAGLTALQELNLEDCEGLRAQDLKHLTSLISLQHLNLSGCWHLTGRGLKHLSGLHALEWLEAYVKGRGLEHLSTLSALQNLNLQSSFGDVQHLSKLTALQHLDLSGWCMDWKDQTFQNLSGLTALQYLDLDLCDELKSLEPLSGLLELQHLKLGTCAALPGDGLEDLSGLRNLTKLDLGHCPRLTNRSLEHLSGLTGLQHLELSTCAALTDDGLENLSGLRNLSKLDLGCCPRLINKALEHLSGLTSLQDLRLDGCDRLTDRAIKHLRPPEIPALAYPEFLCAPHRQGPRSPLWQEVFVLHHSGTLPQVDTGRPAVPQNVHVIWKLNLC